MTEILIETLAPSKIQNHISELFRLQLCRADDHNLAQSTVLKNLQTQGKLAKEMNRAKLIDDMSIREEDRVAREAQILKELGGEAHKELMLERCEKHLQKFSRKMYYFLVSDLKQHKQNQRTFLVQNYPSHLHLAQIMEERTDNERESFGACTFASTARTADEQIDVILRQYLVEKRDPWELLNQLSLRSRDRFNREFAKLKSYQNFNKFFTEEGVKERAQSLKYKFLIKERHPQVKKDSDIKQLEVKDRVLAMLILHNQKVDKIQGKYRTEVERKKKAKELGISLKELIEKENGELVLQPDFKEKAKAFKKKDADFGVEIKVKDDTGAIQNYDEASSAAQPTKQEPAAIETLDMIQQALGTSVPKKAGIAKKKTVKKKKEPVDRLQRFFNNYSENPHLQMIENGYLQHLKVQHAKESHLKAIKKFQIIHALKRIQRYWRKKYLEIQERQAKRIQAYVRKFIRKMDGYREKLAQIRQRLLSHTLLRHLKLYIKKRRINKSRAPTGTLNPPLTAVLKIQGLIRSKIARKSMRWRRYCIQQQSLQAIYLRKFVSKLTRDKETYWIQRFSMGRVESDQITRYVKQMEKKFDINWKQYEGELEKFLITKQQGELKDWIQRKDENGKEYWTNTVTLKSQVEHPGHKIFQINKKLLKNKAQQDLSKSLEDIQERRLLIMEAILGLKDKVSKDISQLRVDSALQTKSERAQWRKQQNKKLVI